MDKLAKIIQSPLFVIALSVVAVYALFLSAILQLSSQLSLKSRLETPPAQVLGEVSSPVVPQPPSGLLARNQRCIAGGTVNVDLFWRLDPQAGGYWIALYGEGGWQTKWMAVKTPTSDGLISLTWQNLKPNSFYYWTMTVWSKAGFSPWAQIQYFQTSNCR